MTKKNLFFLILSASLALFSCKGQELITKTGKDINPSKTDFEVKDEYFQDTFIDPEDFFTLDYTPYLPEDFAKKRHLSDDNDIDLSLAETGNEKDNSIIPGLRNISDYKTEYNEDFPTPPETIYNEMKASFDSAETTPSNNEDFTIVTWGPQKEIPASVRKPDFYVMFSEPVIPLSALGAEITTSDIFQIDPPIKGVYRWNGTSSLTFTPTEPITPQQSYTIKVSSNVKSLSGKNLKGEKTFTTTAEKLDIKWGEPGYKYKSNHLTYFYKDDVPPDAAKECRVQFNYMINSNDIAKKSVITIGDKKTNNFTVTQESSDTVTYNINETIPTETRVKIKVADTAVYSYNTVTKFKFNRYSDGSSYGKYSNPVYLYFSHPVNKSTVANNITTSLDYNITEDNIETDDTCVTIYNLPVTFNTKYTITLNKNIKDIYGRSLGIDRELEIKVPNAESMVNYTDYGVCILEAKYPHLTVFEHQNLLEGSGYVLSRTDNPLDITSPVWDNLKNQSNFVSIANAPRNQRVLEEVNLEPYLTGGKGMVRLEAMAKIPDRYSDEPNKTYTRSNVQTIQVTDLGVTARIGINKTVALVTKLSDGKPVRNADVYLYDYDKYSVTDVLGNGKYFSKAKSDKDGIAKLSYDINAADEWFKDNYSVAILVKTEDDAVTFYPNSHRPWSCGIWNTANPSTALRVKPKTFMFSDRGLYKPGEKVTFRGIDKDLNLGSYKPYEGDYKITIKDNKRNEIKPEESINLTGKTSASGGFYGSFTLPEKSEPGNYTIIYERVNSPISQKKVTDITVSYFERLKFQASVKMPKGKIIAGDTIQGKVSASYLAGGALSSAAYHSTWYSEPWYFTSDKPEFEDYRFGPINNTDNMNYLNYDSGSLDGVGNAVLSCETNDNSIKGSPYRYKVSVDITDASNQLINRTSSVVVHPASFYIGISKPENINYLAEKGKQIDFNYKLALTDGSALKSTSKVANAGAQVKVELLREDWNVVQQQGVNGDVYPRYVKETVTETTKTYNLATSGKFSVTPTEVGYYTVRLSSQDNQGRDVISEYKFFATGSTNSWVMDSSDAALKLTPDQSLYNPGDTATILLESPLPSGSYLITVEREGIFTEEVKHFDSAVNTIEIPIARNYVPVCYVSVASYSVRTEDPKNQFGVKDVDKPKGYYGATTIHVNPYVKAFSIDVSSEKLAYEPGEEAEITITATKGGKPLANAEITVMAVDRGVLDLIDYHVADPINYFYSESMFPLRTNGGDNRSFLIDPVTYAVKNLAGGDAECAEDSKLNQRKDFNPTALFEPVLITDKNGKATCKFKLPDSLTTYRITAFGVKDELLALQEDEIKVQNIINVQQVTPRRLRERDTSELGVIITNLDSQPHEVTVKLETETPSIIETENGITQKKGKAFVDGKNKNTVMVEPGRTVSVYFDVAAQKAGLINTIFTINSDILNEQLIYPMTIEKPYIFEQVTTTGSVTGKNAKQQENIIIPPFAEDGMGSVSLTLDATRLGPLGSAVKYVFEYPYGCLEQQASRILPLVTFEEYLDIFNMDLDEKITDVHGLVVSYFENWSKYQFDDGGFGYWPSSSNSNYYVSARIAETYAAALSRGYTKEELKINGNNLVSFLKNSIRMSKQYLNSYELAYLRYVISLIDPSAVSSTELRETFNENDFSICKLALTGLAAIEIEDKDLAKECKKEISKYLRPTTQGIDITDESSNYWFYMYGSKAEQLALTLQLFTELNPKDPFVTKLVYTLFQNQKAGYWQSTSGTTRVLAAFYTLIKESNLDRLNITASGNIDGNKVIDGTFKGPAAKPVTKKLDFSDPQLKKLGTGKPLTLEFNKEGKGDLYYTASMKYALPYELQIPRDEGISLVYKLYDDSTGEEVTFKSEDSAVVELESGKIYRMDITISSNKDRNFVALRAPIPSGAEILDSTFVTTPKDLNRPIAGDRSGVYSWTSDKIDDGYDSGYYMSNQSILDNEIQFFWDSFNKGTTTATFKFRAVRRGVFPTPPLTAECMYESEIFGRTYGALYTIK